MGVKKMTFQAGTLSIQVLQDFYYRAVGTNVYMNSKISIVNGRDIIGCILDVIDDKIRMLSLMNKEEVIHVSNITGIEILPAFTVEAKLNELKSTDSVYIRKYEFPTNEYGYDINTLLEQMIEIVRAVNEEGCTWFGIVYKVDGNFVTFTGLKKNENEQLVFDDTPIYLDEILEIRIGRKEKGSLPTTEQATCNEKFDAAMEILAGKEVSEGEKNIMDGWQSYIMNKFGNAGNMICVTTKNGKSYDGYIKRYDDAGGETVMILRMTNSYSSKNFGDTYAIRVSEISTITYNEREDNVKSPESYFIQ